VLLAVLFTTAVGQRFTDCSSLEYDTSYERYLVPLVL